MVKKMRKIYLHLSDPKETVRFGIKDLKPIDRQQGASHVIEFRHNDLYTRIWVNLFDLKLRRDLIGWYFADFRNVEMRDRLICPRAMRNEVVKKRPNAGICPWAPIDYYD
jgi:hypothetical protein